MRIAEYVIVFIVNNINKISDNTKSMFIINFYVCKFKCMRVREERVGVLCVHINGNVNAGGQY